MTTQSSPRYLVDLFQIIGDCLFRPDMRRRGKMRVKELGFSLMQHALARDALSASLASVEEKLL